MPPSLNGLADYGLIDEVVRPLMSGKEAQIFLVISQGEQRVAKVYREAEHRDFKHRAAYTEGRTTRNTRDTRAMTKRTSYGRSRDEAAWRSAEVEMIYRLADAGVRVPKPYHFIDDVLIMELVQDSQGEPAPRLGDLNLDADAAASVYEQLLREVIRMLCAGVVHGDLSDFNVLMDEQGPVIIDFPQSVDASRNTGARKLLLRDVENLHNFAKRCIPGLRPKPYAQEMWELFQRAELNPDTELRGHFKAATKKVDTDDVLGLIQEADADEQERRMRQGAAPAGRRREVIIAPSKPPAGRGDKQAGGRDGRKRGGRTRQGGSSAAGASSQERGRGRSAPAKRPRAGTAEPATGERRNQTDGQTGATSRGQTDDRSRNENRGRGDNRSRAEGARDETQEGAAPRRRRRRRRRKPAAGTSTESQAGAASTATRAQTPQAAPSQSKQSSKGARPAPRSQPAADGAETGDQQSTPSQRRRRRRRRGPRSDGGSSGPKSPPDSSSGK